jgi:hypothetical protein
MGNRYVRSAQAIFLACLMAGCAVKTQIKTEDPTTLRGNTRFDCVLVKDYTTLPTITPPPMTLTTAQESTIEYLRTKSIFREVAKFGQGSSISSENCAVVEANLLDIRLVPTVGRVFGGALAGRSHMIMKVKITDAATGMTIAEQELTGAPNAWASAYSIGAADRALPAAMGAFIGDFVLGHSRK